jgi:hypothetical protein
MILPFFVGVSRFNKGEFEFFRITGSLIVWILSIDHQFGNN